MARPEILRAVHELDEQGFYNNTEYLGDLSEDNSCLDNVKKNGIYSFTAYKDLKGIDTTEKCKWSLRVYSCEDCTHVEQIAESFESTGVLDQYRRTFSEGKWTDFHQEIDLIYYDTEDNEARTVSLDADMLGGHPAEDYVHLEDLEKSISNVVSNALLVKGGTLIPKDNSDLNNYTTEGTYYCNYLNHTIANCPTQTAFRLHVFNGSGVGAQSRIQIYSPYSLTADKTFEYRRTVTIDRDTQEFVSATAWYKPTSNIPVLSSKQKEQIVDLMNQYQRVNNTLFYYTGAVRREGYAYNAVTTDPGISDDPAKACVIEHKNTIVGNGTYYKYLLNCGLFCQMIWMGRPVSDFLLDTEEIDESTGELTARANQQKILMNHVNNKTISKKTEALTIEPTISTTINSEFSWGYYFDFLLAKKAYNVRDGKGKLYKYNSYYNGNLTGDRAEKYPDGLIPLGFDGAAYMAEELYRIGCEIPREEMDVGDLVFYRSPDVIDEDDGLKAKAFRNITHVGIVYAMTDGEPTIMDCTDFYEDPQVIGRTSLNGTNAFQIAKSASQHNQTVMVARHPAAYGKGGNVPSAFSEYRGKGTTNQ